MGSGTSRGKKVAPVSDVNGTKTAAGVASSKQDSRSFMPLKIHSILRTARSRAQADCHSEGHDSDISGEEDGIDEDLDTVLAGHEERRVSAKKSPTKKTFIRSKTYGLCHFSSADTDEDSGSASRLEATAAAEEPRGSQGAVRHVNKRSNDASTQSAQHTSSSQGFLTRGPLLKVVPASEQQCTFGSSRSSSLTMPVRLYDGSDEELMDTIEREFS